MAEDRVVQKEEQRCMCAPAVTREFAKIHDGLCPNCSGALVVNIDDGRQPERDDAYLTAT